MNDFITLTNNLFTHMRVNGNNGLNILADILSDWRTEIQDVDDEGVPLWNNGIVQVLPGRHCVRVTVLSKPIGSILNTNHGDFDLTFDAVAGRVYVLDAHGSESSKTPFLTVWDSTLRVYTTSSTHQLKE